jgi:branched-chain amino acid aminotransferase
MAMQASDKIWMDGRLIPWEQATVHVATHALHYGSSVFEGIRAYATTKGTAIFCLDGHMDRFYIRPLAFRGVESLGVNPQPCPVQVVVITMEWGAYLGPEAIEQGVDVGISSWGRMAPNTFPAAAKIGGQYVNSQLIVMEAVMHGYTEGIALDAGGFVSEGSGENIFVVSGGRILTPPLASSILQGITRQCAITLARDLGYQIQEERIPREVLYIADEVFFTGTAAEITPIRSIDGITIGAGRRGPVTERLQREFFGITSGELPDRHGWLTPVR